MNKLEKFRNQIIISSKKEKQDIKQILEWLEKKNKLNKMRSKKVPINKLNDWNVKRNGNIYHKSTQFFSIEGVKINSAVEREVKNWDQPILNQKHGGVLAILTKKEAMA